jgi:hypothetical protein
MPSTTFVDNFTVITAQWLNEVNTLVWGVFNGATTAAAARASINAAQAGANTDITSLNSPNIGAATATTPSSGDNSTRVATTAFVATASVANATNLTGTSISNIPTSALGSGTADNTVFLRGDRTWAAATPAIASTAEAQAGTDNTKMMTPLRVRDAFNASGSAPVYACRAWVNFDGTTTTPTIRASGNVSSVTKNGAGDYTINFATALPDTNYVICGAINSYGSSIANGMGPLIASSSGFSSSPALMTTTQVRILVGGVSGIATTSDVSTCLIAAFR